MSVPGAGWPRGIRPQNVDSDLPHATGDWRQATGDRRQATGDRRQATGDSMVCVRRLSYDKQSSEPPSPRKFCPNPASMAGTSAPG
ncbi:hypothetical protein DZG02_11675 [Clavibacter lycopersici]|nr:hypothetical protein DZG02_11675 [Clavibacter lycopersici]